MFNIRQEKQVRINIRSTITCDVCLNQRYVDSEDFVRKTPQEHFHTKGWEVRDSNTVCPDCCKLLDRIEREKRDVK